MCLNSLKVQDMDWPPKKPTNNSSLQARKKHSFDFKLVCGDSEGRFEFGLYRFVDPTSSSSSSSGAALPASKGMEGGGYPESADASVHVAQHQAVDLSVA